MGKKQFDVLLVEDDPVDQEIIHRAFVHCNAGTMHIVCDGEEAIAYLMGESSYSDRSRAPYPSFIITDLNMPRADGFAVLEHLKANPSWAVIPVVVLSASCDPEDLRAAYMLGASACHCKPTLFEDLCELLRRMFEYWETCLVPDLLPEGQQLCRDSTLRLGERFPLPPPRKQERAGPRPRP